MRNTKSPELVSNLQGIRAATAKFSPRKVLIVGGRNSFKLVAGPDLIELFGPEAEVAHWHHRLGHVEISEATGLLKEAREFDPDLIVGIGGGVSMDYAKLASGWLKCSGQEILKCFENRSLPPRDFAVQTLLIPSLFGSGAEATFHAVVYFDGRKYSQQFNKSNLLSAILVPILSKTASREHRISSALDAICQGVETAWSSGASPASQVMALDGLRKVLLGLEDYVEARPTPIRDSYVLGASEIGNAMNTGKTTAPHAFSYFLTGRCLVPHGYAVGLLFRKFWAYSKSLEAGIGLELEAARVIQEVNLLPIKFKKMDYTGRIDDLIQDLCEYGGRKMSLSSILIQSGEEFSDFLNSVDEDRLANTPFLVDQKALESVFWEN